jgi:U3-containing 90S pre-ribosomal complex subunit
VLIKVSVAISIAVLVFLVVSRLCVSLTTCSSHPRLLFHSMLGAFNEHIRVAKLFAKHMKVAQQADFLAKQDVRIGCGTPNRLQALIENGGLKLDRVCVTLLLCVSVCALSVCGSCVFSVWFSSVCERFCSVPL